MPNSEATQLAIKKQGDRIVRAFVLITLLFFAIAVGFSLVVVSNRHRINDIQQSRTESCKRTYVGIREVFKPFVPPKAATQEQQNRIDAFNNGINRLIAQCERQTSPANKTKTVPVLTNTEQVP